MKLWIQNGFCFIENTGSALEYSVREDELRNVQGATIQCGHFLWKGRNFHGHKQMIIKSKQEKKSNLTRI